MEDTEFDSGRPFGYLLPWGLKESREKDFDFVSDDHPVRDEDVIGQARDTNSNLVTQTFSSI